MYRIRPGFSLILAFIFLTRFTGPVRGDIYSYRDGNGVIYLANRPDIGISILKNGSKKIFRSSSGRHSLSVRSTSRYDSLIRETSNRYGVGFELIKAVIHAESAFDPFAVSRKGAQGLMQLMPETARGLGVHNAFDPRENVLGGTRYLRKMLERYNHDLKLSLAAYNAGPTTVDRMGGVPPYSETRNYIRQVISLMRLYGRVGSGGGRIYQVVKNGRVMLTNRPLP